MVLSDLAWLIKSQATVAWKGATDNPHVTVTLPDGAVWTASSWRQCVRHFRRD